MKESEKKHKEKLLSLIQTDPDVRRAIRECAEDTEQSRVREEYEQQLSEQQNKYEKQLAVYHADLNEKQRMISDLQTEICNRTETLSALRNDLKIADEKHRETAGQLRQYRESYSALDEAFRKYCGISETILASFQSIICTATPLSFLLSGASLENLQLFFEKISMEWKKYDAETLCILNAVFDFLFTQFQTLYPTYHRIDTEIGMEFDLEKHTRTSDSLPVGRITKVIIAGYTNENGTKTMKSFVEIG